jgi:hypothetical protein
MSVEKSNKKEPSTIGAVCFINFIGSHVAPMGLSFI